MRLRLNTVDVEALMKYRRVSPIRLRRAIQVATSHEGIASRGGQQANDEEGSGDKFHAGDTSKSP